VVTSKFNLKELNERIGYGTETLSRGRYAEVLSSSRGFTPEEEAYFEEGALKAYTSFITKAAASRSMNVSAMQEVAQGRVWTGRQALERGLVDEIGGLDKALLMVGILAESTVSPIAMKVALGSQIRVQTFREPKSGLPFPFGGGASLSAAGVSAGASAVGDDVMALCDESIACTGLVSPTLLGVGGAIQSLGLSPSLAYSLAHSPAGAAVDAAAKVVMATSAPAATAGLMNPLFQLASTFLRVVNDEIL
jgi:hypothetical protein